MKTYEQSFLNYIEKAKILVEAIPYIAKFRKKIFIIKYGGSLLQDDNILNLILQDIIFLNYVGIKVILVHGGSFYINKQLKKAKLEIKFHNGIRITDSPTLDIAYKELNKVNKKITKKIIKLKGKVFSVLPEDNIIIAENEPKDKNLGFVGNIHNVNFAKIKENLNNNNIVVLSPMGFSEKGQLYNINADSVAGFLIKYFNIEKFVLLTNVPGICKYVNNYNDIFSSLKIKKARKLISNGVINSGMIPKVESCITALEYGAKKTHIVDAGLRHALLLEFFTNKGIGTLIV